MPREFSRAVCACVISLCILIPLQGGAATFKQAPEWSAAAADMPILVNAKRPSFPQGRLNKRKRLMDPSLPSTSRKRPGPMAFSWFWQSVSPSKSAAHKGRWNEVLRIVENARRRGKAVYGSNATAERILKRYGPALKLEAKRRNVSLPLLVAVIAVESGGNSKAISPKGAGGLMQLMPQTARRFGVSNSLAPAQNIRGGARYLDWLLRRFDEDAVLALAGYNAGEGAVDRHSGVPPYNETRDYVAKVAGAYLAASRLCKAPSSDVRKACEVK